MFYFLRDTSMQQKGQDRIHLYFVYCKYFWINVSQQELGSVNQFALFGYFQIFQNWLSRLHYMHIWQMSLQISCSDICQIWMCLKDLKRVISKIRNITDTELSRKSLAASTTGLYSITITTIPISPLDRDDYWYPCIQRDDTQWLMPPQRCLYAISMTSGQPLYLLVPLETVGPFHQWFVSSWLKSCYICDALMGFFLIWSGHNFAHALTAQLWWHEHNDKPIGSLESKSRKKFFVICPHKPSVKWIPCHSTVAVNYLYFAMGQWEFLYRPYFFFIILSLYWNRAQS